MSLASTRQSHLKVLVVSYNLGAFGSIFFADVALAIAFSSFGQPHLTMSKAWNGRIDARASNKRETLNPQFHGLAAGNKMEQVHSIF